MVQFFISMYTRIYTLIPMHNCHVTVLGELGRDLLLLQCAEDVK